MRYPSPPRAGRSYLLGTLCSQLDLDDRRRRQCSPARPPKRARPRRPTALQVSDVEALDTHWVRLFATWSTSSPSAGCGAELVDY